MLRALDLAEALDAGELRPSGLVEIIEEEGSDREATVRAFAHIDLNMLRLAAARPVAGPLAGLPVAFKDIIDTADQPTEYGSPIWQGWQPRADAAIASLTYAAGGLLLGKAATTELAFLHPAGTTNPHDPTRTPGGSSSGSAAGVAAGMMPLAFGTQTGGSVIRPASYCGVAAMKPSFRLLPMVGIKAGSWTMDTLGLFGARVRDVAFGLEAITGRALRADRGEPGTPTFGVCTLDFAGPAGSQSRAALDSAIAAVERAGGRIVHLQPPPAFAEADAAHPILYQFEGALSLKWELDHHAESLSAVLRDFMAPERPATVAEYDLARRAARVARKAAPGFFAGVDAVLTYAAPGEAPERSSTGTATFNRLFTLLGVPCVNVPGYRTDAGLPVGVQVIGRFGDDQGVLAAADYVERAIAQELRQ